MFRRLAALAVILAALTGFGIPSAFAGTGASKPVCCRPSHCHAQLGAKSCCKMGPGHEAPVSAPFSQPAPQKIVLSSHFSTLLATVDRPLLRSVVHGRTFSTAPPVLTLKSSLLI